MAEGVIQLDSDSDSDDQSRVRRRPGVTDTSGTSESNGDLTSIAFDEVSEHTRSMSRRQGTTECPSESESLQLHEEKEGGSPVRVPNNSFLTASKMLRSSSRASKSTSRAYSRESSLDFVAEADPEPEPRKPEPEPEPEPEGEPSCGSVTETQDASIDFVAQSPVSQGHSHAVDDPPSPVAPALPLTIEESVNVTSASSLTATEAVSPAKGRMAVSVPAPRHPDPRPGPRAGPVIAKPTLDDLLCDSSGVNSSAGAAAPTPEPQPVAEAPRQPEGPVVPAVSAPPSASPPAKVMPVRGGGAQVRVISPVNPISTAVPPLRNHHSTTTHVTTAHFTERAKQTKRTRQEQQERTHRSPAGGAVRLDGVMGGGRTRHTSPNKVVSCQQSEVVQRLNAAEVIGVHFHFDAQAQLDATRAMIAETRNVNRAKRRELEELETRIAHSLSPIRGPRDDDDDDDDLLQPQPQPQRGVRRDRPQPVETDGAASPSEMSPHDKIIEKLCANWQFINHDRDDREEQERTPRRGRHSAGEEERRAHSHSPQRSVSRERVRQVPGRKRTTSAPARDLIRKLGERISPTPPRVRETETRQQGASRRARPFSGSGKKGATRKPDAGDTWRGASKTVREQLRALPPDANELPGERLFAVGDLKRKLKSRWATAEKEREEVAAETSHHPVITSYARTMKRGRRRELDDLRSVERKRMLADRYADVDLDGCTFRPEVNPYSAWLTSPYTGEPFSRIYRKGVQMVRARDDGVGRLRQAQDEMYPEPHSDRKIVVGVPETDEWLRRMMEPKEGEEMYLKRVAQDRRVGGRRSASLSAATEKEARAQSDRLYQKGVDVRTRRQSAQREDSLVRHQTAEVGQYLSTRSKRLVSEQRRSGMRQLFELFDPEGRGHISMRRIEEIAGAAEQVPPEVVHLVALTRHEILPKLANTGRKQLSYNHFSRMVLDGLKTLGLYHRQGTQQTAQQDILALRQPDNTSPTSKRQSVGHVHERLFAEASQRELKVLEHEVDRALREGDEHTLSNLEKKLSPGPAGRVSEREVRGEYRPDYVRPASQHFFQHASPQGQAAQQQTQPQPQMRSSGRRHSVPSRNSLFDGRRASVGSATSRGPQREARPATPTNMLRGGDKIQDRGAELMHQQLMEHQQLLEQQEQVMRLFPQAASPPQPRDSTHHKPGWRR